MLLKLVQSDAMSNHRILVVSLLGEGDLSPQFASSGVSVFHSSFGEKGLLTKLRALLTLRTLILNFSPDLVHSWLYASDLLGFLATFRAGVKSRIWSIRQSDVSRTHNKFITRLMICSCALLSHYVPCLIVSNSRVAANSHVSVGYCSRKIEVIPNGINVAEFKPNRSLSQKIRQELAVPEQCQLVGMIARFDSQKNHLGFFESMAAINVANPNVNFILCGQGVDDRNEHLTKLISKYGLCRYTKLLGQRSDICAIMNTLDVLVLPSSGEGWPNVIGEAMACGIPCVVTKVGDVSAIVANTGSIVVPRDDRERLTDATLTCLELSDQERQMLARVSRDWIKDKFDIQVIAKEFERVYLKSIIK